MRARPRLEAPEYGRIGAVERWFATAGRGAIAGTAAESDGEAMSTSHFEAQALQIPGSLRRQVEGASLATASHIAQIGDSGLRPAVIAINDGEVVLVTRRDTRRWKAADLDRVEGHQIVPREGAPVVIGSWRDPERRTAFLRAVRELLGQPEPAPVALELPPEENKAPVDTDGLAKVVGVLGGIVTVAALASSVSWLGHVEREGVIGLSALVVALLGLPLLICSSKLAGAASRWRPLGIAGVVLGGLGSLLLAFGIYLLIVLSNCDGNCIGG